MENSFFHKSGEKCFFIRIFLKKKFGKNFFKKIFCRKILKFSRFVPDFSHFPSKILKINFPNEILCWFPKEQQTFFQRLWSQNRFFASFHQRFWAPLNSFGHFIRKVAGKVDNLGFLPLSSNIFLWTFFTFFPVFLKSFLTKVSSLSLKSWRWCLQDFELMFIIAIELRSRLCFKGRYNEVS